MDANEMEKVIEAALFMSSRPMALQEIGKLVGIAAPGFIEQKVKAIAARYESAGSAIEISEENGKYYMRLRHQYVQYVKDFAQAAEISKHSMRTLAYISKNDGIRKSDLCRKLGSSIYVDVAELVDQGFVHQKKNGRSTLLTTTPKFKAYFEQNAVAAPPVAPKEKQTQL